MAVDNCNKSGGRTLAQALSRRPLTADALAHSQASPCGICGRHIDTGTDD